MFHLFLMDPAERDEIEKLACVRPPVWVDGRADAPPCGPAAGGHIAPDDRDEAEGTGSGIAITPAVVGAPSGGARLSNFL